jgi:membrane protease YdiL (CAAX protease family)
LLQAWLESWFKSALFGLAAASVLFGAVHLTFHAFPNWRFAILAAVAGVFYGRAYMTARSVRAAMVTHALVNTAWRVFFS